MEKPIDINKTKEMLEPDVTGGGGLHLPGKDRVVFRPPERKSLRDWMRRNGTGQKKVILCLACGVTWD